MEQENIIDKFNEKLNEYLSKFYSQFGWSFEPHIEILTFELIIRRRPDLMKTEELRELKKIQVQMDMLLDELNDAYPTVTFDLDLKAVNTERGGTILRAQLTFDDRI